mgnify:CR=1 FL=1
MGLFDSIIGQVSNHPDVANLATKVGLDQTTVEKAIAALGVAHQQSGDTLDVASRSTGLDTGVLGQIVYHLGGEGSLTQIAALIGKDPSAIMKLLDRDGDGNPINDIANLAKGFFGKS